MNTIRSIPVYLSALLMAAHFLRAGSLPLVILSLTFPLLLLTGRLWAVRLVQAVLVLAALEWLRTLAAIVDERQAVGESWTLAAVIIGSVALFAVAAALILQRRPHKKV
ncbi:hypothetical protein BMS3Abin01_00595 [bacterium BMS3Abin01]|nr:hypothetical protein BMS3Abin01_00595 [bacterium BMS3Abin01]